MFTHFLICITAGIFAVAASTGRSEYACYRHVFFDRSLTPDHYYHSEGSVSALDSIGFNPDPSD